LYYIMELHVDPWKLIFLVSDVKSIWIYWERRAYLFIHCLPNSGSGHHTRFAWFHYIAPDKKINTGWLISLVFLEILLKHWILSWLRLLSLKAIGISLYSISELLDIFIKVHTLILWMWQVYNKGFAKNIWANIGGGGHYVPDTTVSTLQSV